MNIVPQQSRIVVEPIEEPDQKIVLPENVEEGEYQCCRVVAVGTGRVLDSGHVVEIPLKVGDEVVFDARYAVRLTPDSFYGGRKLAVVDYAGVLCKVEREAGETVPRTPLKRKILAN